MANCTGKQEKVPRSPEPRSSRKDSSCVLPLLALHAVQPLEDATSRPRNASASSATIMYMSGRYLPAACAPRRDAAGGPRVLRAMGGAAAGWLGLAAFAATFPLASAASQATFVNLTLFPRLCVPTNDTTGACAGACALKDGRLTPKMHSADPGMSCQTPDASGFFCSYAALGSPIHVCVPAAHSPPLRAGGRPGGLHAAICCCAPPSFSSSRHGWPCCWGARWAAHTRERAVRGATVALKALAAGASRFVDAAPPAPGAE